MKKTILYLIIVFVGLSPLSLNAQLNNVENEEKIDVSKYMTSKSLNIEVKEFFIKQIRETKLVKDIDNHEFVHFFLDRYDHQYKKMIKSKFIDETVLLKSVAKIKVGNIIEMLASDFNQYKIVNPNVHKNYNNGVSMRHFDIFDLGNRGPQNSTNNKGPGDSCNNPDFETGNVTGWDLTEGDVNNVSYGYINVVPTTLASAQLAIMTGGNDPVIGAAIPTVNPTGGSYSLRLGDGTGSGGRAAGVSQTFLVDANSAAFTYSYALVLEDPSGHTVDEKPFFKVNMYDQSGGSITCGDYSVISGPVNSGGDPDFIAYADGFYLPWRTTFAPLQSYVGQNVTLEFIIGDCSQSGHYGYGYIDASCEPLEIIPSQTVVCGGNPVTLTAPAGAASYLWSPGGETTQSISTNTPGTYTVSVIPVTGPACALTLTATIGGSPDFPIAAATATPTNVCAGTPIIFNNTSYVVGTSAIDSVHWDFDSDGNVDDTTFNTTYTYSSAGSYTVTLTVFNNGCTDDTTINITITPGSLADFSALTVCEGSTTNFIDGSLPNGTVVNWDWDFDNDGTVDNTNQNPNFTFPNAGTYSVSLSVSGAGNSCPHDTIIDVIVSPVPIANFSASTECFGTITTFIDSSNISSGTITNWNWDFDNNGTVDNTNQNPTNVFSSAGTHTVNLSVGVGSCTHDTTLTVVVKPSPIANFTTNLTSVCLGTSIIFNSTSSAVFPSVIDSLQWDFDNDGTIDDITPSTTYTYSSIGNHTITLVTYSNGCVDDTTIVITVVPGTVADFSADTVCAGSITNFVDGSIPNGTVVNWGWDFDNNGTIDNSNQNPSFTFSNAGTYSVSLSVSGVGGSCPHDTVIDIIVSTVPVSNFSASNQCEGTPINFIDLSVGSVTGWNWDFDNNGTVDNTNQNPNNIFTIAGTYLVNLNVESGSCSHDTTINIIVDPMPLANFSATSECSGVAVVFTDMSNSFGGSITSWNWDFDNDGTVDNTIQNPNNIFTVAGTYPVNLSVEMGTCTHDTVINVFVSVSNFSAALDFTPPTPCGQDSFNVVLNFIGLGADSLVWNMGDGTTFENITSVDYSYIDAGTYPISMTVYNYACNIVKTINSQVIFFDVPDSESIVPNVFTPNGDGINDELIVLGVDETAEFEIKIFNRWGKLVFESSSLINNWDGKVGNDVGSAGTYFYILTYTDVCNEEIKISKGAVTLLK